MRTIALILTLGLSAALVGCDDEDLFEPDVDLDMADFELFDVDGDRLLTGAEFEIGFADANVFGIVDEDDDGFWDEEEFDDDLGSFGSFDVDVNGFVDAQEFFDGAFDVFDVDDDAFIDEDEFGVGVELF